MEVPHFYVLYSLSDVSDENTPLEQHFSIGYTILKKYREKVGSVMQQMDALIDAFLQGDTLFRFVYLPATGELFLEDELDEADNGKFANVPFKDSRELYLEMADFVMEQDAETEAFLYKALSSPSPIDKFHKMVGEVGLAEAWEKRKREFAKRHIEDWLMLNGF